MRTVAAPMPREPPVIRATLLERERAMDIGETVSNFFCPYASADAKRAKPVVEIGDHRWVGAAPLYSKTRSPFRLEFPQKQTHQHSVEARAAHLGQLVERLLRSPGRCNRLLHEHIGVSVRQPDNPGP